MGCHGNHHHRLLSGNSSLKGLRRIISEIRWWCCVLSLRWQSTRKPNEVNCELILWIQTRGFFKDQLAIQSKILINKWQEIKENYFWQIQGLSEIQLTPAHDLRTNSNKRFNLAQFVGNQLTKTKACNKLFNPK